LRPISDRGDIERISRLAAERAGRHLRANPASGTEVLADLETGHGNQVTLGEPGFRTVRAADQVPVRRRTGLHLERPVADLSDGHGFVSDIRDPLTDLEYHRGVLSVGALVGAAGCLLTP